MTAIYSIKDEDGNEVSRIVADTAFVEAVHPGRYQWIEDVVPPAIEPVFPTLTRKELRKALLAIDVTAADIEDYIAAIADPIAREDAAIDWQDTKDYERSHPLLNQIGLALGIPPEQIDALWMWAAKQT